MFQGVSLDIVRDEIEKELKNSRIISRTKLIGVKYASMKPEDKVRFALFVFHR